MRKFLICLTLILVLPMIGGRAIAVPFGDGGAGLQGVFDNFTIGPNPGVSSTNVLTDELSDDSDSYWSVTGSGGSIHNLIIEMTSGADLNVFGIYDASDPTKMVQLYDGPDASGTLRSVSILADGSVLVNFADTGVDFAGNRFGYYLDSREGLGRYGGIWYSDTNLNTDEQDHMAAYQGKDIDTIQLIPFSPGMWMDNEYILAFDGLNSMYWGYDGEPEFTDFVVMVESVNNAPEPATMLLVGSGLIGLTGLRRKFRKK